MTDKQRILQTIAGVYSYYGRDVSEFILGVWMDDLAGYSPEEIDAAFVRHRRDPERGRFCPLTADILKQLEGDESDRALVAWGKVLEAARNGGGKFSGATQQALEAMGGMGRIRMASASENGFLQREFCGAFKAYKAREDREQIGYSPSPEVLALMGNVGRRT